LSFIAEIPKNYEITLNKRNIFNYTNRHDTTSTVVHQCHNDPMNIRHETDTFCCEFNNRLSQIIVRTFEAIYFNVIVLRLFVPPNVNIREDEFIIYTFITTISTFVANWLYYIPLGGTLVAFNQNAHHLGYWSRLSQKDVDHLNDQESIDLIQEASLLYNNQNKDDDDFHLSNNKSLKDFITNQIHSSSNGTAQWVNWKSYYKGDKCYYLGNIYECQTTHCASIPNNSKHLSFYHLFAKRDKIPKFIFFLQFIYVMAIVGFVWRSRRWYSIIVLMIEVMLNTHTLYISTRDLLCTWNQNKKKHY
jgi:hypothetical protein